ncbi:MAG: hypothetical protein OXC11_08035, partial [Rhodospirillales bacterium]|nr:hypothetical protein [Rhodospirillales bacterium]
MHTDSDRPGGQRAIEPAFHVTIMPRGRETADREGPRFGRLTADPAILRNPHRRIWPDYLAADRLRRLPLRRRCGPCRARR